MPRGNLAPRFTRPAPRIILQTNVNRKDGIVILGKTALQQACLLLAAGGIGAGGAVAVQRADAPPPFAADAPAAKDAGKSGKRHVVDLQALQPEPTDEQEECRVAESEEAADDTRDATVGADAAADDARQGAATAKAAD